MKKNQKKITIIIVSVIAALSILTTGTIAYYAFDSTDDEPKNLCSAEDATLSEEELIDKKEAEEFEKFKQDLEKTNLMTYTIMRKYGKTTVTETIMDKRTDLDLIWVMCDMIENNEFTPDELTVIKKYLDKRYNAINIPDGENPIYDDEDELEYKIEELLNFEHRRDYIK